MDEVDQYFLLGVDDFETYRIFLSFRRCQQNHPHCHKIEAQGKFTEAEPLFRKALLGCEEKLGKRHPHTLTLINNLAGEDGARFVGWLMVGQLVGSGGPHGPRDHVKQISSRNFAMPMPLGLS